MLFKVYLSLESSTTHVILELLKEYKSGNHSVEKYFMKSICISACFTSENVDLTEFLSKKIVRVKFRNFHTREANFSGFLFIAINDKFGPIYRDKIDKIR